MKHSTIFKLLLGLALIPRVAAAFDIATTPLFVTGGVPSNVIVTLDTSTSMYAAHTPDGYSSHKDTKKYTAASFNPMYYNPNVQYELPKKFDGSLPSTSYAAAYVNGFNTSRLPTLDFSLDYKVTTSYNPSNNSPAVSALVNPFAVPYVYGPTSCTVDFDNNGGSDRIKIVSGCSGWNTNLAAGAIVTITGSSRAGTYTVTGVNSPRIDVGNPWNNDLNGQSVTLSWSLPTLTTGPAFYHLWYANTLPATAKPASCDDTKIDDDCYIPIQVGTTADIYKNADGSTATDAQKKQNFANWFSFYRTRTLALMSAANLAFWKMSSDLRLAWQNLDTCNDFTGTDCVGVSGTNYPNYIKKFSGDHRDNFFKWIFDMQSASGTPLRVASQRVGEYYRTAAGQLNSPYAEEPQVTSGTEFACRKNFHILMTDGQWNTTGESGLNTYGNQDGTNKTLPDGVTYTANATGETAHPYNDNNSDSLSDVLFYYWATDLRTDIDNQVLPLVIDKTGSAAKQYVNPKNDPAIWQHMTTFTVGLGMTSSMTNPIWAGSTYAGDYSALVAGSKSWPATTGAGKVYDLWHGALNSRGQFFSAEDPNELVTAFKQIVQSIEEATPSASALAANSTSLDLGTRVYQAKFDTTDWSGHLYAYDVDASTGTLADEDGDGTLEVWDAATQIPAHASRNIYVNGGSSAPIGVAFLWDNLDSAQKTKLNVNLGDVTDGSGRVSWLRGDSSGEVRNGGAFRNRTGSIMGDIVASDPAYIGASSGGYDNLPGTAPGKTTYSAFLGYKSTRTGALFVGANDGMLHSFRVDNGQEVLAVIPNAVFDNLAHLTDPAYSHKYFVDGSPGTGDAYLNNSLSHPASGWNTIVAIGLGAGGNSIIAVDATSTTTADASQYMWEYADPEMGYTYSQPQIVRLTGGSSAGHWAAVFGNGYKTSGGDAYLYIVNLSNGSLIKRIKAGSDTNNGLSTPTLVDVNNDQVMDYAYAGDLQGNMWKFDLTDSDSDAWSVANGGAPLFTAIDTTANRQAITVKPTVAKEETSGGYWVFFGTGRYLATEDVTDEELNKVHTFYGIWDNGSAVPTSPTRNSMLTQQTVIATTTKGGFDVRSVSDNSVALSTTVRGWYLDMPTNGERIVSEAVPVIDNISSASNRIVFTTIIPSNDVCDAGGDSWLMEVLFTGQRPGSAVFDLDGVDGFDSGDDITVPVTGGGGGDTTQGAVSGIKSTVGIMDTPTWVDKDSSVAFKLGSGTSGGVMTIKNKGKGDSGGGGGGSTTRVYWQQLM